MKARIVRIGNSRWIRIPKRLLDQTGLDGDVELRAENGALVIPARKPRAGWEEKFRAAAESNEGRLMGDAALTRWDEDEWTF